MTTSNASSSSSPTSVMSHGVRRRTTTTPTEANDKRARGQRRGSERSRGRRAIASPLAHVIAFALVTRANDRARAMDSRTAIRKEIKASDFERLEDFERARGGRASSRVASANGMNATLERGIPVNLASNETSGGGRSEVDWMMTEPPKREERERGRTTGRDAARFANACAQWSAIAFVALSAYRAQRRSDLVTKRLGLDGASKTALVGTTWVLECDIGRERGTWMPPAWGASGMRLIVPVAVEFKDNGETEVVAVGAFAPLKFGKGEWSVDGDALRFNFPLLAAVKRGDIEFGEEKLYFKTQAWANQMSAKGRLLVKQTRFGFRREWRSVGAFKAAPYVPPDDDASAAVTVPPMRVRERFTL